MTPASQPILRVGFTGSRHMGPPEQVDAFVRVMLALNPAIFDHGDAVGWDNAAADLVSRTFPDCRIIAHPPSNSSLRAFNPHSQLTRGPLPYLARNKSIVNDTRVLVACPYELERQPNGGTWFTVRYAEKIGRRVIICWREGAVDDSEGKIPAHLPPVPPLPDPTPTGGQS